MTDDALVEAAAKAIYPVLQDILNGRPMPGQDVAEFRLARAALTAAAARIKRLEAALRAFVDPDNAPFITECDAAISKMMDDARTALGG